MDQLTETENTTDEARLDVAANGFWGGRFKRTYLDVEFLIVMPHPTRMLILQNVTSVMKMRRKTDMNDDCCTFTPLVFSTTGGMARECSTFYKQLASLTAFKHDQPCSKTLYWMQTIILFALLRSSVKCIRGARSSVHHAV